MSAQLKVIISGGFSGAYEQLVPEFERAAVVIEKSGMEPLGKRTTP